MGADGADAAWFPRPGERQPLPGRPWYNITVRNFEKIRAYCAQLNTTILFGVNFRLGKNASILLEEVRAINDIVGWKCVEGIEIGNEPDLYPTNGYRSPDYSYDDYAAGVRRRDDGDSPRSSH